MVKIRYCLLLVGIFFMLHSEVSAVDSVVKRKAMLGNLFRQLDGAMLGEEYLNAVRKRDEAAKIRAVAEYFRRRPASRYLSGKINGRKYSVETAERAVNNDFTVINIPWKFEGKPNWIFNPTWTQKPVNHEWLWQFGRMAFWHDMARCYQENGDERFAEAFENQFLSWIFQADRETALSGPAGNNTWRTIECGIRLLYSWPAAFEVFRKSPAVSDETLCLMLSSMFEQAEFLRHNHRKRSNWLLMEMSGVYTFASEYPEFRKSKAFRLYSVRLFGKSFCSQMLPDGMHDELSPDYQLVSLGTAKNFIDQARLSNRTDELPEKLMRDFEAGFEAYAALMTPMITAPRTNDCYTTRLPGIFEDALEIFPDNGLFQWIASCRKDGQAPSAEPTASRFLPYAGFIAMRSNWDADALYCCFDVGPIGNGHQHWDKLNINIYKGGEELIFDDGGGQYEKSAFRWHGRSAADHNTVLVDNMVQMRYMPKVSKTPVKADWITNAGSDYARASYTDTFAKWKYDGHENDIQLFKPAVHTREVRFCKPEFFCVVDTLKSVDGKFHDYELRFQLDTVKMDKVKQFKGALLSDFGKKYDMLIVPLFPGELKISTVSGRTKAPMAGWFVGRNDLILHPSTTVRMLAKQKKNFRFATLLFSVRRGEEMPEIIHLKEQKYAVNFKGRRFEVDLAALNK